MICTQNLIHVHYKRIFHEKTVYFSLLVVIKDWIFLSQILLFYSVKTLFLTKIVIIRNSANVGFPQLHCNLCLQTKFYRQSFTTVQNRVTNVFLILPSYEESGSCRYVGLKPRAPGLRGRHLNQSATATYIWILLVEE